MVTVTPQDCPIARNLARFERRYNTNGNGVFVDRTQQRIAAGQAGPGQLARSKMPKYGLERREEQVGVRAREAQRRADLQHIGIAAGGADQDPLIPQGIDHAGGQFPAVRLHTHEKTCTADRPNRRLPGRQCQQSLLQVTSRVARILD